MTIETRGGEPVTAAEHEVAAIKELQQLLERDGDGGGRVPVQVVTPDGQTLTVPGPIYEALRRIVPILAHGDSVALVTVHKELTTRQAAELLDVSQTHLIQLLDEGALPSTMVGMHRHIRLHDVLAYKTWRHEENKRSLDAMAALSQEYGIYD